MEKGLPMEHSASKRPLEVDIRKILEQLGIHKEKWPEEFAAAGRQSGSNFPT
ncbi:hypothetical protein [Cohnella hongkongensis]|uniref:Uncharacterized protein n=1 Tax=Cohnella hongkongensis TaxID=178337 RepID=A0ABV9F9F6_9BACL